jgi:hypothetical protein
VHSARRLRIFPVNSSPTMRAVMSWDKKLSHDIFGLDGPILELAFFDQASQLVMPTTIHSPQQRHSISKVRVLFRGLLLSAFVFWTTGCTMVRIDSPQPSEVSLKRGGGIILKPSYGQESTNLSHAIAQEIAAKGFYNLVDRRNISNIVEERNFQRMSMVENRGRGRAIRGADAILTLSANPQCYFSQDSSSYTYKGKTYTSYSSKTTVQYPVNYSVVDVHTSMLHTSKNLDLSDQRSRSSSDGYPSPPCPDSMLAGLRQRAAKNISHVIHPRIDRVSRTIAGTKSPSTKSAIRLANSGLWPQALEYAQMGVREYPGDVGALHALGVIYQGMGRYNDADVVFNNLVASGGAKFAVSVEDNRAMAVAARRYQEQVR